MWTIILFLGSLALAGGAGWTFLQYKSPSKKEKIAELAKQITEQECKIEKLSDLTSLKGIVDTSLVGITEDTQDTKEQTKLAQAKELAELVATVKKEEDLSSKSYSYLNIGLAAGIFLLTLLILNWIAKRLVSVTKQQE